MFCQHTSTIVSDAPKIATTSVGPKILTPYLFFVGHVVVDCRGAG